MVESWLLRKQVEAKIFAAAFAPEPEQKVDSDLLFAMMGVPIEGK